MTGTPDTDDSWAEFYREIGLEPDPTETPEFPPAPQAEAEPEDGFAPLEAPEAEVDDEEEGEEGTEVEGSGGEEEETNEDGTKKRRRRRRRRSKKKGPGLAEGAVAEVEAGEPAEETAAVAFDEDGGPSPEASRELIANWDVPSWTEIVAGLHRPTGR